MSPARWRALLDRYVAGEPIKALAAEYRVSPSAIYRQAKAAGKRKRDVGAPTLRKGPPPLIVEVREDGRVLLACGREGFVLDTRHPERSVATLLAQADDRARVDDFLEVTRRLRMVEMVRRVLIGRSARSGGAGSETEDEDAPDGPPLKLRTSQRPPAGDWSTWLFLGGRGAGKTLAGASWLADQAGALGPGGRLALIGPTLHDVREVMIEGVSGIRSLPRWTRATRPKFQASRRRLVFANGCLAYAFSAEDPDSLRGPQFSAAWADEFCAWRGSGPRGAAETLALLRMGLRLPGPDAAAPRLVVTTTPRPTRALVRLRDEATCAHSHAPTADNTAHLSAGFLDGLHALYGGTRRAAQELEGKIVELDGALFTAQMMQRARATPVADGSLPSPSKGEGDARPTSLFYERTVVAIDPTATAGGAACGLIAGASYRRPDGVRCAVVLADRSIAGLGPDAWARRAVALAAEFGASALVAEVNQGGDMVRAVLKTAGNTLKIREVHATRGKYVRAEPVAALYEQGRIHHAGAFDALEEELMAFGGEMEAAGSLDRADALVWAITDLLIDAPEGERGPRIRQL
ncbi:terminase large subunit domain-containing protein [Brevundimonas sp.]|uniref:terminase large subunit domain-containing protein n=1 Tax=Brevundimonas sp. TaxID=1871086 RepID=UPI002D6677BE|nr:terminase family protein [Brevundimonas sp.]HYC98843.1 terminase family protein [Brevundimonas sp.]